MIEYQKLRNFLGNTPNQPTKFRTKNWVEINRYQIQRIMSIVKLNLKL